LLSSLVATTYSADFGHSASPLTKNLVDTKYFAITAGISNNSNFLNLIKKDRFRFDDSGVQRDPAVKNKTKGFDLAKQAKIKGQLEVLLGEDTDLSLNIIAGLSALVDVSFIIRPSQYFHFSWQAMTIVRNSLFYYNLKEEGKKDEVDNTKQIMFWVGSFFPSLTFNTSILSLQLHLSYFFLYGSQLEYGDETMKFYSGILLSGIRICPKFSNNPLTNVITAKVLDLGFAAAAAYFLQDFSFKYWKKEEKKSN